MVTPFGKLLRIFRVEHDLTMRALATELGVTSAYISGLENGKFPVTAKFLNNFFQVFNISSKEKEKFESLAEKNTCFPNSTMELINALSRKELSKSEIELLENIIKKVRRLNG